MSSAIQTVPHKSIPKDGALAETTTADGKPPGLDTIQKLIGNDGKLKMVPVNSVNLDLKEGYAHSTTGIPYAIEGSASVIATTVAAGLLESQDPIKAILSTEVHQQHRIIITRKYVVGGGAQITPERAPARTVSIQEDVREVTMERYGGDLEMNLNLFLRPDDAKEELNLKLDAQKLQLDNKLIELGYDAVMADGTNVVNAIMRSNPTYTEMKFDGGGIDGAFDVRVAADRIYSQQIFGALQKHKYAIPNLLASVKYASAYTLGTVVNPTVVLPHGVANILKYARPESMQYNVSGVKTASGKALSMKLDRSFVDEVTGAKILIHYPRPSYEMGSVNPRVGPGGLSGTVKVVLYYNLEEDDKVVNFQHGGFLASKAGKFVRVLEFAMASAIVAAPGGKAGRLLVGYPMTGVSTSQATETMRVQLRTYLGACVTDPESVMIIPNCTFQGLIHDTGLLPMPAGIQVVGNMVDLAKIKDAGDGRFEGLDPIGIGHRGTTYGKDGNIKHLNAGHLGLLDTVDNCNRVWGAQVYSEDLVRPNVGGADGKAPGNTKHSEGNWYKTTGTPGAGKEYGKF